MSGKGSVIQQLEGIWRDYLAKRTNEERVKWGLAWEDWEGLGKEAVGCATREVKRRRWRGVRNGVVPQGYDPESIAAEVIRTLFAGEGRLAAGWTRERLVKELERLIGNKVRVLYGLKESGVMRSEWEVLPRKANGEAISILEAVPADGPSGYDAAVEAEGRESARRRIEKQLKNEPELRAVFDCLCAGETKSREIARRVGTTEKEVALARRRLRRKLAVKLKGEG